MVAFRLLCVAAVARSINRQSDPQRDSTAHFGELTEETQVGFVKKCRQTRPVEIEVESVEVADVIGRGLALVNPIEFLLFRGRNSKCALSRQRLVPIPPAIADCSFAATLSFRKGSGARCRSCQVRQSN